MKTMVLDVPEFGFIVATRAVLAAGVGLLLAERFSPARRRSMGAALVAIGAATTIPAAISVIRGMRRSKRTSLPQGVGYDAALVGAERFPRKGDDDRA